MWGGYGYGHGYGHGNGFNQQSSTLEIPLKDSTPTVNLVSVLPGRMALKTKADFDTLLNHLNNMAAENRFSNEEEYQAYLAKSRGSKTFFINNY